MEKQLLKTFLDLYSLNNKVENWSLKEFQKNAPRLVRLQMIDSLFLALNIQCSYSDFMKGLFIKDYNLYNWDELKAIITNKHKKGMNQVHFQGNESAYELQVFFQELFEYRLLMEDLVKKNSGVMAASGVYKIPFNIMKDINRKITKEFAGIEQILAYLLNPGGLQYSIEELNLQFGYPIVDLMDIDFDWL
jgi:hypothetical protein